MLPGRDVVSCWAGFRPSAGSFKLYTDKTGSTFHCVVSFVMPGNLSNMVLKQKTADCLEFQFQDDFNGRYLMFISRVWN